jgi:hypothetical protein
MGRAQVREEITAQIQDLQIPNVGTVFPARPVILKESDYTERMNGEAVSYSGNGSGCVIVVNLPTDRRERIALTGIGSVNDFDKHAIALELFFASTYGAGIEAQQDYDAIVDILIPALRAKAVPGPAIWMAGGEVGTGIEHSMDEPYTPEDGNTILINGIIRYEAWEQLVGVGV